MSGSEVVLYQTADGLARVECRFEDERVWLTQAQLATLYQTTPQNITQHLRAIYAEAELTPEATCKEYLQVRTEGRRSVSRAVLHYDLSAIVAVGFRVRSPRGTQFRQWAIDRLGEYLLKGFTMDDARLKNPPGPGVPDYFDEQLERIRDIAARADATQPNMGLTTWARGAVRKSDVTVAKNYLNEGEIDQLNRIVVMFLDYAEDQATRRKQVFLREWATKLDEFLKFNDRPVLATAGRVSREDADAHAGDQYEAFAARRRHAAELSGQEEGS